MNDNMQTSFLLLSFVLNTIVVFTSLVACRRHQSCALKIPDKLSRSNHGIITSYTVMDVGPGPEEDRQTCATPTSTPSAETAAPAAITKTMQMYTALPTSGFQRDHCSSNCWYVCPLYRAATTAEFVILGAFLVLP